MPLLSTNYNNITTTRAPSPIETPLAPHPVPTIRLVSATPPVAGPSSLAYSVSSTDTNLSHSANLSVDSSWTIPSPIAPKSLPNEPGPRKRLIPKRSKLGLVGGLGSKKSNKDFSDVVRRVGGPPSTGRGGFDIYVDQTDDAEIGEIMMVRKKKSRGTLDGMKWGALGEVTNVPAVSKDDVKEREKDGLLKVKGDEKEKWWSIGRGRKDSREKTKEKEIFDSRSKTPEPLRSIDSRARFNSLDSGVILTSAHNPQIQPIRAETPPRPATPGLLPVPGALPGSSKDSVAARALRSVRSLARIGSWAQLRNTTDEPALPPKSKSGKEKEKGYGTQKKKKRKTTTGISSADATKSRRSSGSSFEAGHLSASPEITCSLGKKKSGILNLPGMSAPVRLPTSRSGSHASSLGGYGVPINNAPPGVDSAFALGIQRDRLPSTMSTASSLRPMSTSSGDSGTSSAISVRWDEEGLETVKEMRKKKKESRRSSQDSERVAKSSKESRRHSGEGRKRTPVTAVFGFPEAISPTDGNPILTVEEATADGHDVEGLENPLQATPVTKPRPRPLSEQMLGRSRPLAMHEEDLGAISVLDAATNDLAQLINHLDLEATPGTPQDRSAIQRSPSTAEKLAMGFKPGESPVEKRIVALDSPVKMKSRLRTDISISSLRPYAQTRKNSQQIPEPTSTSAIVSQQIAPWPQVDWVNSPPRFALKPVKENTAASAAPSTFRMTHKRTLTPAPEIEPPPVFQPLKPAKKGSYLAPIKTVSPSGSQLTTPRARHDALRSPSSLTFGSHSSGRNSKGSSEDGGETPTPSPVFSKAKGHVRQRSSLVPADLQTNERDSVPIEANAMLDLTGTVGRSSQAVNVEEFQTILTGRSDQESVDDTTHYYPAEIDGSPVPGSMGHSPQFPSASIPLQPLFPANFVDEVDNHAEIDEGHASSEDDTKKSFDFTGELKKLNESGASDRRSFVEHLENAFRTPAKIDLRYGFSDSLCVRLPPIPAVNSAKKQKDLSTLDMPISIDTLDVHPTVLPGSDSLAVSDYSPAEEATPLKESFSRSSNKSDGELKMDFKFGGRPSPPQSEAADMEKPLTLSDIIPPASHVLAMSQSSKTEDNSVLKSAFARVTKFPSGETRMRVDSDCSEKREARETAKSSGESSHARHSSGISFAGMESFAEVRRGFEFTQDRPAFYPPSATRRRRRQRDSSFSVTSFASVSSYGQVLNPGCADPFDYGEQGLPDIPQSEDECSSSMSLSVNDTFSFIRRDPRDPVRKRVDSDASSFYFNASNQRQSYMMQPYNRRRESAFSVASIAPPVSLHNHGVYRRRNNSNVSTSGIRPRYDSNASVSSMAFSYAAHDANGGRVSWAEHHQDDSISSDFSARHLGRPGVGDKMFDSAPDSRMPLTSISASPPENALGIPQGYRMSYDSILDNERRRSSTEFEDRRSFLDSIFDQTDDPSSASSESVFGYDELHPPQGNLLPPHQFRPLSVYSNSNGHSSVREDETMISMLGGGHVRRRSVASVIEASPCVRVEKRKQSALEAFAARKAALHNSSNEARVDVKPPIDSTTPHKFGGEHMIRAQRGIYERRSLEDSCLTAEGEDMSIPLRVQPVFSRPDPASRSRFSTWTSSSGADTPPLSAEDGSSQSEGSQSSIDLSSISIMLSNTAHPHSARDRARARARGEGHRRRISQVQASRSSVYETIEEEIASSSSPPPSPHSSISEKCSIREVSYGHSSVYIVDPETASNDSFSMWDDEKGIRWMRKYHALKEEAEDTVVDSKRVWVDTPFSLYALQSFVPPRHPAGMRALLQHSLDNYGPLPPELRRIRSRTQSRPSPYPHARSLKTSISPDQSCPENSRSFLKSQTLQTPTAALQQVSINPNIESPIPPVPSLGALKSTAYSPFMQDDSKLVKFNVSAARPRVPSNARRTAFGWSKRGTGKNDNKENTSQGLIMTPSESLRLNRPRPRGRPISGSVRPVRV